ncbi:MAG: 1-(5-phosphoribosyl)-5-[(5-phosphoribosylamino)methylideneamino]imidazole-4-carboxamide isomerase [Candidatus Omnitrophota bacterium]|jgi:phosphoribosylformimino-5-aminoimidazole carboxamide ribotide isomerase|nr:1-(5-phosphoribosyl)-5-[(5-phosphoribosylamino)methylideneamino]imidazole-4-carboxamide isomerase [Candidatus Omnitrophota bacterium]
MIKVIPAIDIRDGKVVRLTQGKAECETVYFDSPLEVARIWATQGAELIHVVDLDGAIEGKPKNLKFVKEMIDSVNVKIELGGGIRDLETMQGLIDAGIEKVVIGTRALEGDFISKASKMFGGKIVVGIDAKDGIVLTKGWLFKTEIKAVDLAGKMAGLGIKTINYTDISRDGMMSGPNIGSLKEILKIKGIDIIASGGVSTIEDVRRLKALESRGLKGMIIGKALYEKTVDLKEAIRICSQKE